MLKLNKNTKDMGFPVQLAIFSLRSQVPNYQINQRLAITSRICSLDGTLEPLLSQSPKWHKAVTWWLLSVIVCVRSVVCSSEIKKVAESHDSTRLWLKITYGILRYSWIHQYWTGLWETEKSLQSLWRNLPSWIRIILLCLSWLKESSPKWSIFFPSLIPPTKQ